MHFDITALKIHTHDKKNRVLPNWQDIKVEKYTFDVIRLVIFISTLPIYHNYCHNVDINTKTFWNRPYSVICWYKWMGSYSYRIWSKFSKLLPLNCVSLIYLECLYSTKYKSTSQLNSNSLFRSAIVCPK